MQTRNAFNPVPMAANALHNVTGSTIAGFLPTVSGTLTITGRSADGTGAVTLVDAVPVTAGIYVDLPCALPSPGAAVQLAGGAKGTLFV